MATYLDAVRSAGSPRRLTFLSGRERVLVEDLVGRYSQAVSPAPGQLVTLSLAEDSDRDVWDEAFVATSSGARRLVVVRDAERLKAVSYPRLKTWAEDRRLPNSYLILVGGEDWPSRLEVADGKRKRVYLYGDVRDRVAKTGRLVVCSLPRDSARAVAQAVEIISSWGAVSPNVAEYLYRRTGSLEAARDVMLKAAHFPGEVTRKVVDALTVPSESSSYVDLLLAGDSGAAATAALLIEAPAVPKVLDRLEDSVLALAVLNRAQRAHEPLGAVSSTTGIPVPRMLALMPYVGNFDQATVGRRLELIAQTPARSNALALLAMRW